MAKAHNTVSFIQAALLDGKPHHTSEFLWIVEKHIEPQEACRAVDSANSRIKTPESQNLEAKIAYGKRIMLRKALYHMVETGVITIDQDVNDRSAGVVQLTPDGLDLIFKTQRLSFVVQAIRKAVTDGDMELRVTLNRPAYLPPPVSV